VAKSSDFIGLNLYTSNMVLPADEDFSPPSYYTDDDITTYQVEQSVGYGPWTKHHCKRKAMSYFLSDQIVRKVVHIIHSYIHTNSHPPHWLDRGGGRRKKGWGDGGGGIAADYI
jgi:hypothetical protein